MAAHNLTPKTLDLFMQLACDAGNWSGNPLFQGTKEQRGNLTDLKKAGLLNTFQDEGCTFIIFTEAGLQLASDLHIDLGI